jgi:hypothetical protein
MTVNGPMGRLPLNPDAGVVFSLLWATPLEQQLTAADSIQ